MTGVVVVNRDTLVQAIAATHALHSTMSKDACVKLAELSVSRFMPVSHEAITDALVAIEIATDHGVYDDAQDTRLAPLVRAMRESGTR